jgi:hypothetical protein
MSWLKHLGFDPSAIGEGGSGWIPPDHRTTDQSALHREVTDATPFFGEVNTLDDLPDSCVFADLEMKALGKLLQRIWQMSGSCVGTGGNQAYCQAIVGDVAVRGDREEIKRPFPWATYGVGRQMGGMTRRGDGSFGSAQAKAVREWGMLAADDPRLPKCEERGNWIRWSSTIEREWSHPSGWPIRKSELDPVADDHLVESVSRIRSTDELAKGAAQGYGITLASMFGTRDERVDDGFLLASWSASWAHQMSCGGYAKHPRHGRIWWIQNQWGPTAHPKCPFMSAKGVDGGFWIIDRTMATIISKGEVFVHSNTKGFPARKIAWGTMGIV